MKMPDICALTMNVRESNPFLKVRTKRRDKYDVYIISFCCMEPSPDPEPARRAPSCAVEEWRSGVELEVEAWLGWSEVVA